MDRMKEKGGCPGVEELSAWFDGYGTGKEIGNHIEKCGACARVIEDYRMIQTLIAHEDVVPDEELLNARICARVHQEALRSPRQDFTFFRSFGRIAALVAVAGCVGLLIGRAIWSPNEAPPMPAVVSMPAADTAAGKVLPSLPYYTGYENKLRTDNSIPIQNMANANYGDRNQTPVFSPASDGNQAMNSVPIESNVHQVWTVNNLQDSVNILTEFSKQQNIMKPLVAQNKSGTLSLNAILDKEQLVKLVRYLDGNGYNLLSPNAPQPEQRYFQGYANDKVVYSAEFVLNK